jgi:hypothetical protein
MSFEKTVDSAEQERQDVARGRSVGKKPYFGMTGIQLNIWVTVACTTAMTLFGECPTDDTRESPALSYYCPQRRL